MKINLLISTLLITFQASVAQTKDFGRRYSDTIPENFNLNVLNLRDQIYAEIPSSLKKGDFEKKTYRFAYQNAYGVAALLSSGKVYSDWLPLENYINEIYKKIVPPELKNDTSIHFYIIRRGGYNAFMTASGKAFINIGTFAYVSDESELAGIMAHELAHYYLRHSLQMFIETEQGTFDFILFKNNLENKYSVKHELQADSLAMTWLNNSGYNIEGMIYSFKTMNRLERNILKRKKDEWELKETTHPLSVKRLEKLNAFYNEHKSENASRFLIDEKRFYEFKEEAKGEILKYLLNNFQYSDCIEKSFQFHIFDPDNSLYVYYLMESIRRNCYMDADIWNKNFIIARYYDSIDFNGKRHKERMEADLFKTFDLDILTIDPRDGVKIKAKFYWRGSPKFRTYEEAFNFFFNVSKGLNNHECILSNALSYTHDKVARDKYLQEYLTHSDIKHKEYAENLLAGTEIKKLHNQKMIVFNNFITDIRQGKESNSIYVFPSKSKNEVSCFFDSVMAGRKNQTSLFMLDIKNFKNNSYDILSELESFSFGYTVSKGEKTELQILDPRFWETFNKYNTNEIEFVNCVYTEEHGKDKTFEGFKNILELDYRTLFVQKKYTRYFDIYITGLREIEGVSMKTRFYGGQKELKSNEPNLKQMIYNMKYEFSLNEKKIKEFDSYNPDTGK